MNTTAQGSSSYSITQRTQTAILKSEQLKRAKDATLKQQATKAAGDKDAAGLFAVLWAYTTRGSQSNASQHTADSYERGIRLFVDFCNRDGVTILRLERQHPDNFVEFLNKQYAPKTVQARLAAVRSLYAALRWAGATDSRPWLDIKAPSNKGDDTNRSDKPYTRDEIAKMLAVSNDVDCVLILLGAHGGLRVHEAVSLQWHKPSADASKASYLLPDNLMAVYGKGARQDTVEVSPTLTSALEHFKQVTPYKGNTLILPFTTVRARQRLQAVTKRANVTWRGVHGLRHFCGTELYLKTKSVEAVKNHLRHRDVKTTDKYIAWGDSTVKDALATM